ncbi:phosphodiester glycosidase family protein [Paenibacillus beijingensis]|uniref:Exopolysaccharide biosynthesis protein n=1 Tax=Paenibacillus beijingensis TaxID=1126833 RepID=A0A0D5NLE8_9BACL|nr:phosphodiester glycosidase family protein [Paenibacillus beijingensis]AJY75975.1 exopolysaccharide biosynthesis protein [Paenibacillus beijingensis]
MSMKASQTVPSPRDQMAAARRAGKRRPRRRKLRFLRLLMWMICLLLIIGALGTGWLFLTPSGNNYRYLAADTIITTQHRVWAKYLIGQDELNRRVAEYQKQFNDMGSEKDTHQIASGADDSGGPLVQIEPISGASYKGYVMTVKDPTKIRLGVPAVAGKGEKVTSMVRRYGAVAGVNAGGFADPNWKGNGFQPIGVVISQGKVYYEDLDKKGETQIVGIDKQGKMVAGHYSLKELIAMGVQEGVTFQPRIIVNGKGLVKNHADGWGIAPRTAMGQRADGAIIFVVIDGRQPGYSIGADLYDVQKIMLDHGAVIAANLDGGSSSVLVNEGGIVNKPSSKHGERYLPTAWLVFDHPEEAQIPNVWEGLTAKDIDPAKW